ncbi:MAG: class I SAM-dependent methyltransferase [bacterium]|nr:class I SAM-dependent methyltransferase [bacterium]
MHTIDSKIHIPEGERLTSIKPQEAQCICDLIKEHGFTKTLEVGFAYGYSAAYIIWATDSKHIVIDPFQKDYQYLGIKNLEALGFQDKYELKAELSHLALPVLLKEGTRFQFVFIDGGHRFDEIFIDWYYSDLLLEKEGYIMFHDSWMRSTQMVAQFIRTNRKDYKEVPTPQDNLILFKKVGDDHRLWYHFKEFFTFKSFFMYYSIKKQIDKRTSQDKGQPTFTN